MSNLITWVENQKVKTIVKSKLFDADQRNNKSASEGRKEITIYQLTTGLLPIK
jgi:hypothetical protein